MAHMIKLVVQKEIVALEPAMRGERLDTDAEDQLHPGIAQEQIERHAVEETGSG